MIDACREQGVLLLYAEELFFAPKYVKAKQMADQGAFGDVYLVKQWEKHSGPHADWFWDVEQSGGGVLMDMGCHGIAFATGSSTGRRSSVTPSSGPTSTRRGRGATTTPS